MSQAAWFSEWIPQFPWFSHKLGKYIERKVLEWKMLHDVFLFPVWSPRNHCAFETHGATDQRTSRLAKLTGESFVTEFLSQLMFAGKQREIGSCPCVRSQKEIGREERSLTIKALVTYCGGNALYLYRQSLATTVSSTVHSDIPVPNMKPQAPGGLDQRLHLGIKLWANICLDNKVRNPILRPEVMRKLIMICAALYAAGTAFLLTGHTAISEHDLWYRIFNWQDS